MGRPTHCQEFYELDLQRINDAIAAGRDAMQFAERIERNRAELRWYQSGTRKLTAANEDLTWLDTWVQRALPWLVIHKSVEHDHLVSHVRLLHAAPAELRTEERITFATYDNDDGHVNLLFASRRARQLTIDRISDRKKEAA